MLSAKGWTVNFGDMASYYKSSLFLSIAAAFLLALGRNFPMEKWLVVAVYGAAAGVLSLIAFVYAGYYGIYHIAFAAGDMLPVVQTSWKEVEGFLLQYAGMGRIAAVVWGFLVYWAGCVALAWYGMRGRGCSRVAAVEDAFASGAHGDLAHTGERSAEGGFSFL